jgi:hypothetical protein
MEGAAKTQHVTEVSLIAGNPRAAATVLRSPVKNHQSAAPVPCKPAPTPLHAARAATALLNYVLSFFSVFFLLTRTRLGGPGESTKT